MNTGAVTLKTVIYADILVVINIMVNYLLLRASTAITGHSFKPVRFLLSSAVGGFFSLIIFVENISAALNVVIKLVFLAVMMLIAFEVKSGKAFAKCCAAFLAANFVFAGIMFAGLTAVSRSVFPGMILHFANNLLDLYAGDFLNELSWLDSDMYFFRFVLVLLFLISLWRVFSRMQHIYFQYSENPPKEALGGVKPKAKGAFRSWTLLLPICAYLIITAITS